MTNRSEYVPTKKYNVQVGPSIRTYPYVVAQPCHEWPDLSYGVLYYTSVDTYYITGGKGNLHDAGPRAIADGIVGIIGKLRDTGVNIPNNLNVHLPREWDLVARELLTYNLTQEKAI
jgi:hypothetical protein